MRRGPEPAPLCCYRLSRLAWEASRCRLRFLTDRRRRFMNGPFLIRRSPEVTSALF
jgi:hypothetical protein